MELAIARSEMAQLPPVTQMMGSPWRIQRSMLSGPWLVRNVPSSQIWGGQAPTLPLLGRPCLKIQHFEGLQCEGVFPSRG